MGSKKHKKESKKKKHRSRSRSPLEGEERERKRHKKHKDRKKDRSPDVEEVPVDSHLGDIEAQHSRSRSPASERDRRARELRVRDDPPHGEKSKRTQSRSASPSGSGAASGGAGSGAGGGAASGAGDSLSVEETNRLRAKLGLKPLEVAEKPAEDGKFKDDLGEFYHKPAANISEQKKAEKLREKLQQRKDKRKLEQKLQTPLLADGPDEDDALAWVRRQRELQRQKRDAAKRAAMLDELDAEFGVSALVAEEQQQQRHHSYAARHLKGLRVAHDLTELGEEREVVLTLADKHVLADDAEDELVNVNMVDDDKYKKNIIDRKKAKAGYQAYDDEADLEAAALGLARPVLSKYDEEIDKTANDKKKGFRIGDEDALEAERFKEMMRRERLRGSVEKRLESLQLPELRLAADYLDDHEVQAKFKKPRRKGKMRAKPKAEPIDVDAYDAGSAPLDTDDTDVAPQQLAPLAEDEHETEPDGELQAALARARRLRQGGGQGAAKVEEILSMVKEEPPEPGSEPAMVLDATAEFCRTLGDIPTYGQAGNRDHAAEIMDLEREEAEAELEEAGGQGAWSRVDTEGEGAVRALAGGVLGAEPALGAGVAGALRLALSKGYLDRGGAPQPKPSAHHLLNARHYSIEDKTGHEEASHGRRERGYCGPLSEFREKAGFRPSVKLDYVDDDGRALCPKEAFRYLSHKFHGKGPGKNKQEKRLKKVQQEGLMKKMSSTDTPLGTLQMLQDKQRETKSAYVVLSGAKKDAH